MSDRFEARLSSFVVELLEDPPEAPSFPRADVVLAGDRAHEELKMLDTNTREDQLAAPRGRWFGPKIAVAAFVAVILAAGVAAWISSVGGGPSVSPAVTDTAGINSVSDVAVTPQGTVYALSEAGIAVWDAGRGSLEALLPLTGLPGIDGADDASLEIHHVEVGDDGTLWAAGVAEVPIDGQRGVATRGWIARFDGTRWSIPAGSTEFELPSEMPVFPAVSDLAGGPPWPLDDGSKRSQLGGSVWALAGQHLVFFDGGMWWDYETPYRSRSVDVGINGEVWLGTDDGQGPWQFGGGVFPWESRFSDISGEGDVILPTMFTHQVAVSDSGTVWMATEDGTGIVGLQGREVALYTTDDGLLSNFGNVLAGAGDTVVVVHENGVSELRGDQWSARELDLTHVVRSRAVLDPAGVLWIPSDSGIIRVEGGKATTLAVAGAIP